MERMSKKEVQVSPALIGFVVLLVLVGPVLLRCVKTVDPDTSRWRRSLVRFKRNVWTRIALSRQPTAFFHRVRCPEQRA